MNGFEEQLVGILAEIAHQLKEMDTSLVGVIQRLEDISGKKYVDEEPNDNIDV